jgi:hypothetical protein
MDEKDFYFLYLAFSFVFMVIALNLLIFFYVYYTMYTPSYSPGIEEPGFLRPLLFSLWSISYLFMLFSILFLIPGLKAISPNISIRNFSLLRSFFIAFIVVIIHGFIVSYLTLKAGLIAWMF